MNYNSLLRNISNSVKPYFGRGKVAAYIPALAEVPPQKFGMAVHPLNNTLASTGDAKERFSAQSITKILTLALAMKLNGDKIWRRVGREPSGNPFNSLVQLEHDNGIPRNPLINAGALVIADELISATGDAKKAILEFVRKAGNCPAVDYDERVAQSEREHGERNAAMAYFLKSYGNLKNEVEEVLDVYFHHCSIAMNCEELASAFLFLANQGINPTTGEQLISYRQSRRINAIMLTAGMYDAVGEFAFRVGVPAKSGVGGGIVAVIPGKLTVAVWSPELNPSGNSLVGMKALEIFTAQTGLSIF